MTEIRVVFTPAYEEAVSAIEDFLFESARELAVLEWFWDQHDRTLRFIRENPATPAAHPATGDQSWPFGDGHFRLFFKLVEGADDYKTLYLTHIIDNRQANTKVYPGNKLPTYEEE